MAILASQERLPDPLVLGVDEKVLFAALGIMALGALAAWWWDLVGGLAIFCGYGLFWYLEGSMPERVYSIFPLAACLFLIAWMLDHQPSAKPATPVKKKGKKRAPR